MNFQLIESLREALMQPLPGEKAHKTMLSYSRQTAVEARAQALPFRLSAVLLLLYPKANEWHTVLTLRHNGLAHHRGQISLPGGSVESGDLNLDATALRETNEELNIPPKPIKIIGHLSDVYIPPSRFIVHPVVGYMDMRPEFKASPAEVEAIIETPINNLLKPESIKETTMNFEINGVSKSSVVRYYNVDGYRVWGATAMMLAEFCAIYSKAKYHMENS